MAFKKTCYHSELASKGPVWITMNSDVLPSTYPGKPDWCAIMLEGVERNFNCETPDIAEALRGYKGHQLQVTATGSGRDGTAALSVNQDNGPGNGQAPAPQPPAPVRQSPPARPVTPVSPAARAAAVRPAPAAPARPPAPPSPDLSPEEKLGAAAEYAARLAVLYNIARRAAVYELNIYAEANDAMIKANMLPGVTDTMVQGTSTSIFLSLKDVGLAVGLPHQIVVDDNVPS